MSISVSGVSRFYGRQQALKNVSFEISRGEVVGFLGPNGAGKSTMMKILTGYLPASEGEAKVCGHSVAGSDLDLKRKIGYLPEHNPLYPDMYVVELLKFTAAIYKIPKASSRIEEIIALTGLQPERHKKIGALSKGYRQRVGLAQALLPDPEVLILDEPTTGFDPNQVSGVRDLIRDLGKSKTIMLSTHIMQEVQAICKRVIIVHQGSIVADDRTENLGVISSHGDNVITAEFEDKQPRVEQLNSIVGVKMAEFQNGSWIIHVARDSDPRGDIFRMAVQSNLVLLRLEQQRQTLESVFQALTRN